MITRRRGFLLSDTYLLSLPEKIFIFLKNKIPIRLKNALMT